MANRIWHPVRTPPGDPVGAKIAAAGIPVYLHSFSAIDSYLCRNGSAAVYLTCAAGLADLARLFENLRYPGAALADAAADMEGKTFYFRCEETGVIRNHNSSGFLAFYQDCASFRFYDPNGMYPILRSIRDNLHESQLKNIFTSGCYSISEMAMILARYFPNTQGRQINEIAAAFNSLKNDSPGIEQQRQLLTGLLEAENPFTGFELLKKTGYISAFWPELAALDDVDHSKEFHPEGNVWKHTMETLRYRKTGGHDLRLSLGLLLHDAGKPLSASAGSHRFEAHAELGERQARRFLERLCFSAAIITDVCYLVRNHMLPAALPKLPLIRTGEIMASPLFPTLLELYRCDESSSFKGLDGYYQSSAAYQAYLKYRRNPYRSADGKKLNCERIIRR